MFSQDHARCNIKTVLTDKYSDILLCVSTRPCSGEHSQDSKTELLSAPPPPPTPCRWKEGYPHWELSGYNTENPWFESVTLLEGWQSKCVDPVDPSPLLFLYSLKHYCTCFRPKYN